MSVPLLSNFGKNVNDLFKKKFEFDPVQFKTIRKAKGGVTVESGAVNVGGDKPYLRGYTKLALARPSFGSADVELHTDADQVSKLSSKFTKLYPGLALTLALSSKDKAAFFKGANYVASAEATYNQANLQAQATLKTDAATKSKVDASASVGYENWSVGVSASVDSEHALTDLQELQFGAEYSQEDLTLSAYTSTDKAARVINGSLFQRVNRDLAAAALVKYNSDSGAKTLTVGSDFRVDVDTGVKAKLELPKGNLQLAVEHRLQSPQLLLGLATEFDVSRPQAPVAAKFGLSLTFGDF